LSLAAHESRGVGRDVVDHPRGGYDDVANAAVGALLLATVKKPQVKSYPCRGFGAEPGPWMKYAGQRGSSVPIEPSNRLAPEDRYMRVRHVNPDGTSELRFLARDPRFVTGGRKR
jgi:hypothetical protein